MTNIKNISIKKRLNFILGGSVIAIILFISIFSVLYSQGAFSKILNANMISEMENLNFFIDIETKEKTIGLETSAQMMSELFNAIDIVEDYKNTKEIDAIDITNYESHKLKLPKVTFNGMELYGDTTMVDRLGKIINGTVSIDQRIEGGFVCSSTNIKDTNGNRTINFFIPEDSDLGKKFLAKKLFITNQIFLGVRYISAYLPIIKNNKVTAVVVMAIEQNDMHLLKEKFYEKKFLESGYAVLVSKEGKLLIHPDKNQEGTSIADQEFFKTILNSNKNEGTFEYTYRGEDKLMYYEYNKAMDSYILVNIVLSEYNAVARKAGIIYLIVLLVAVVLFATIGGFIVNTIKKPLDACVNFANEISDGNILAALNIDQKDELGQLASSLRAMIEKLKEVIQGIRNSSETIVNASYMVNEASQSLSNSSNEQASTVEEVSSTMEEMVSAIKENSLNAENTNKISLEAQNVMGKVFEESNRLAQSVNDISGKISIINQIAMQTNILSLNARVEAAKAGVEGRGFSVVAEEIRNLADVSKNAADEIINISKTSLDIATNSGIQINDLMPRITETTNLVSGISAASNEQYNGAEQVNFSMQQVNESIQSNASASEELSNSAKQLSDEVQKMEELISFFKL